MNLFEKDFYCSSFHITIDYNCQINTNKTDKTAL
jgi:hypothetical protein